MKTNPTGDDESHRWVMLGIKMPAHLKNKIAEAAAVDERNMSDWSRLKLRDAAEAVLSRHQLKVADQGGNESTLSIPAPGARVSYPKRRRKSG